MTRNGTVLPANPGARKVNALSASAPWRGAASSLALIVTLASTPGHATSTPAFGKAVSVGSGNEPEIVVDRPSGTVWIGIFFRA